MSSITCFDLLPQVQARGAGSAGLIIVANVEIATSPALFGTPRSRVASRTGLFRPGSGLDFWNCFGLISGLNTKLFITFRVTVFSFHDVDPTFAHLDDFREYNDCDFLQLVLFANTDAFFRPLLELVSCSFWEGDSGEEISMLWRCFENTNHLCDSWLIL